MAHKNKKMAELLMAFNN